MGKNQLQMWVPWYFATFAGESKFEVHGKLRKFGRRFSNRGVAQRYTRVNKSTKGEVHQFCFDEKNWLKYMFHFFPRSTWRPSLKFSGNFCIDRIDVFIRHVDSILAARGRWQRNQKLPQVPINAFRFQGFQQDLFLGGKGNGGLKKRKVDRLLFGLWKGNCWENCGHFARGKDRFFINSSHADNVSKNLTSPTCRGYQS